MDAPIRLPIRPPIAAPATPAAIRSPVPPPNWDPMKPPVRAPISVPVFSLAPCPVSGVALHAANAVARSTAALRRPIYMRSPPWPVTARLAPATRNAHQPVQPGNLIAKIGAKLWPQLLIGVL